MKIESLGITISVVMVCLLTFMPLGKGNNAITSNLNSIPKEISYQKEYNFDIEKVLDEVKSYDLKGKIQNIIKKNVVEEKKEEEKETKKEEKKTEVKKGIKTKQKNTQTSTTKKVESKEVKKEVVEKVFDNMTMAELTSKLNKSLNSTLSNKGAAFAKYSVKYGVDPYLALAIALHETGCSWGCSTLVKKCNNVGGQKGSPGCGGGSYQYFSSLDAGIEGFISNIYNNYYKYGLNTAEKMNSKYAESTTWATQVNRYIESIKSK